MRLMVKFWESEANGKEFVSSTLDMSVKPDSLETLKGYDHDEGHEMKRIS